MYNNIFIFPGYAHPSGPDYGLRAVLARNSRRNEPLPFTISHACRAIVCYAERARARLHMVETSARADRAYGQTVRKKEEGGAVRVRDLHAAGYYMPAGSVFPEIVDKQGGIW